MKLEDVLDDLCARFIINLPEEERSSFERLGFQVEQAFWFYDDFYRPNHPHLPRLTLRSFGKILLQRYPPLIAPFGRNFDKLYDDFMAYKQAIPVCGAIILNETYEKCLLVKGWSSKSSWGFPKGKIGKDEDPADCAVREVFEETGYDIGPKLSSNNYIDAITSTSSAQATRLFIIPSVPESTYFEPQTRKEISKIEWHWIEALPTKHGQDNSYYNVIHFVRKLKNWISVNGNNNNYNARSGGNQKVGKNNSNNNNNSSKKKAPQSQPQKQKQTYYNTYTNTNNDTKTVIGSTTSTTSNSRTSSPINSILMRDNPSPIHLFEKLPLDPSYKKITSTSTNNTHNNEMAKEAFSVSDKEKSASIKTAEMIEKLKQFSDGLSSIKIDRNAISSAINKSFSK